MGTGSESDTIKECERWSADVSSASIRSGRDARAPTRGLAALTMNTMTDLVHELTSLLARLDERGIEYALCGGLAMAVHGLPRATADIDLLIEADALEKAKRAAGELGYTIEALPMSFSGGTIEIRRISKIPQDTKTALSLDFLLVTPALKDVWTSRQKLQWDKGTICVVSREGLIRLKTVSARPQDLADIERLVTWKQKP